jgi:hypothetical protein
MMSGSIEPHFDGLGTILRRIVTSTILLYTPGERGLATYCTAGWVGLRVGLNNTKK